MNRKKDIKIVRLKDKNGKEILVSRGDILEISPTKTTLLKQGKNNKVIVLFDIKAREKLIRTEIVSEFFEED